MRVKEKGQKGLTFVRKEDDDAGGSTFFLVSTSELSENIDDVEIVGGRDFFLFLEG